jgi:hypothetical protein
MIKVVLFVTLLLSAMPAAAISRYTSTAMSCGDVQARIRADGAAIMQYRSTRNPNLPLYGRYVRSAAFCNRDEWAKTVYIPTADRRQCPVYECEKQDFDSMF